MIRIWVLSSLFSRNWRYHDIKTLSIWNFVNIQKIGQYEALLMSKQCLMQHL